MVFNPDVAPKERYQFMEWFAKQTEWSEGDSYDSPDVTAPALQKWFKEMILFFPPMNGPLASNDDDNPRVTDHCIGKNVIYSAFAWSCAGEAHEKMRELAIKHKVGFFDVSSEEGEILFPEEFLPDIANQSKPWWRFW